MSETTKLVLGVAAIGGLGYFVLRRSSGAAAAAAAPLYLPNAVTTAGLPKGVANAEPRTDAGVGAGKPNLASKASSVLGTINAASAAGCAAIAQQKAGVDLSAGCALFTKYLTPTGQAQLAVQYAPKAYAGAKQVTGTVVAGGKVAVTKTASVATSTVKKLKFW